MSKKSKFIKTKIIATVGPACNTKSKLKRLILAGADVFRLNFSHGSHEEHANVVNLVRELNEELGTNTCLLQDLQGPKIRIEEVEKKVKIFPGQKLVITTQSMIGNSEKVSTSYKQLPKDVKPGDLILVDDGKIHLEVEKAKGDEVITKVIYGGKLKSRKGMNLPHTQVSVPSMSKKDRNDLQFALENDLEWVALSFVRSPKDILALKKIIENAGKDCMVIAKIEKPEAVDQIDEIIQVSDGIMVARGDLGVEMKGEKVPILQKEIVEKCRRKAKPVIIATQMMESMIENPKPTRAETNDVANAVLDGADTLMLSAETAVGLYPVEVVKTMVDTIGYVEENGDVFNKFYDADPESEFFINDEMVHMSARISNYLDANALVGLTNKGYTAFKLASYRPRTPIYIFTHNSPFIRTMNLVWGVRAFYYNKSESTDSTFSDLENILKKKKLVRKGDRIINLAAMPINQPGRVNATKVTIVN